jgi:benzoyl-CoA reductase/2-hydroxyglutaryl-CoA dehydratase subunit BcrC/BadD/HgdB
MLPVRVAGDPWSATDAIEPHIEPGADPGVKSIAARLVDGTYDYLDHLVIGATPAIYAALYGFFVEARRLDPRFAGPRPFLFDFLPSRCRTTSMFNRASLAALCRQCAEWSGQPVSDAALATAIRQVNVRRRRLAGVAGLRVARRLTGTVALQITGSAYVAPADEVDAALQALLAEAGRGPVQPGTPVVYSGTETETTRIYEQLESGGALIVADDQEWGSRIDEGLVDEDLHPLDAICDRYQFRAPQSAGRQVAERQVYLADLVRRTGAAGVIFHILAIDHPAAWDYPRLRDHLHASGIATVELGPRRYRDTDDATLQSAISHLPAPCAGAA